MSKAITNIDDSAKTISGETSTTGGPFTGVLGLANGGTGSSTLTGITGTGSIVANNTPYLINPIINQSDKDLIYTDYYGNIQGLRSPAFRTYLGVSQNLPPNSQTLVNISTYVIQRQVGWNGTLHRYQPLVHGIYQCSATVCFGTSAGEFSVIIIKNGTPIVARSSIHVQNSTSFDNFVNCSGLCELNGTTDYIELYVTNTTPVTLINNADFTNFSAVMVMPWL